MIYDKYKLSNKKIHSTYVFFLFVAKMIYFHSLNYNVL